jgi:hypothetical protein
MTPVPAEAGFNNTRPAPKIPSASCGIEEPLRGTWIMFRLAISMPLRIAMGTSFALPAP